MGCIDSTPKEAPPKRNTTDTRTIQTHKAAVTLHYFELHGRGEPIRLLLKFLKLDFLDHTVSFDEWPALKQSGVCEFGQMPMLEMDGKKLVCSRAILRYIAMKNNMYPTAPEEIYEVESVCDFVDDIYADSLVDYVFKKTEDIQKYKTNTLFKKLKIIEARLIKSSSDYFVGTTCSLADIYVLSFVYDYFLTNTRKEEYEGYLDVHAPQLDEFVKFMLTKWTHLQKYYDERPEYHA